MSISKVYHALYLLGALDEHLNDYLLYAWQYLLRLRANQPSTTLNLNVINRYGEFCGSTSQVTLTTRELDVLNLICLGRSNEQIARELSISVNTVKVHLRGVYKKLGVRNRVSAATKAIRCQLVPQEEEQKRNWRTVTRKRQARYG